MANVIGGVTVGHMVFRELVNADIYHSNQIKTYSNPEFSDDSLACFISSQECNVLFLLECLQMRVPVGGVQLDYYNHPK